MPKPSPPLPMGKIFEDIRQTRRLTSEELCTLQRLEEDETRMPDVWHALASHGFCRPDIEPLLVAIIQAESIVLTDSQRPDLLDQMLKNLESASEAVRNLSRFLEQSLRLEQEGGPVGDEDGNTIQNIQAWRSTLQKIEAYVAKRRERYLPAANQIRPTSQKDNPVALFSINLSRMMEQNFGQPFDEIVSILTEVVFQKPEAVPVDTTKKRRDRDADRRSGGLN